MAGEDDGVISTMGAAPNGADTSPQIGMISQYVKDLSFENPAAPQIYQSQTPPEIDVQFSIGAKQVADEVHEVVLKVTVKADIQDKVAFLAELDYAGLFGLRNIPAEHVQPFLLGEAPRLLFPFARRVVADAVRDGGFPPLLLEPIDFQALYFQQAQAAQSAEAAGQVGTA